MKTLEKFKDELLADPAMRQAYEAMEPEFEIARAIIRARVARGLTQAQLAERVGTSQSFIAKLESGGTLPSTRTLLKIAEVTGTRPRFALEAAS